MRRAAGCGRQTSLVFSHQAEGSSWGTATEESTWGTPRVTTTETRAPTIHSFPVCATKQGSVATIQPDGHLTSASQQQVNCPLSGEQYTNSPVTSEMTDKAQMGKSGDLDLNIECLPSLTPSWARVPSPMPTLQLPVPSSGCAHKHGEMTTCSPRVYLRSSLPNQSSPEGQQPVLQNPDEITGA